MRGAHLVAAASVAAISSLAPAELRAQGESSTAQRPATLQTGVPRAGAIAGRPTVVAVRAATPPTIDGSLEDPIWRTAALIDRFVQEEPQEGEPSTEKTEVRIAYDSERLYFGIYAHYSDISQRRANRSDRDKLDDDDSVTIYIEPFLDYLRGYSFSVNGYGVQRDSMIVVSNAQDNADGDVSWNALFTSGGQLVEDGWTAEMAIPIKSLRYPSRDAGETHRWGFQVRRKITSKDERAVWAPVSRNVMSFLAQIGILDGISNLSTQRNLEVLPTFTAVNSGRLDPGTGVYGGGHVEEGGFGVKYGINSNLTLDFTYNPDFSQIESDNQQIEVNNRFPVNFAELRPFFLEGREIYEIPGMPRAVETRRIVDPRYAAKVTGKIGSRTSIGLFVADDEAPGKVDITHPAFEKKAQNVLGRVKYELYRNSHIGVLFTDREFMDDYSRMVTIDTALRIGDTRNFGYRFYKADREEGGVRRTGWATEGSIRQEARNLRWAMIANAISPDFSNALSFVQRSNQISLMPQLSYRWWPSTWLLNWGPSISPNQLWDFDGVLQNSTRFNPGASFTFARNITLNTSFNRTMERFRGVKYEKYGWSVSTNINTSRKISVSANYSDGDEVRFTDNPFLGVNREYGTTVTVRPSARIQSILRLTTSRLLDRREEADRTEFDVKVMRSTTTYQFTPRLLLRGITELNVGVGSNHTVFQNFLVTYRVNSGTVFYVGYDDRFRQGDAINSQVFPTTAYERTNRAVFTKFQYLFRNGGSN